MVRAVLDQGSAVQNALLVSFKCADVPAEFVGFSVHIRLFYKVKIKHMLIG